MNMIPRKKRCAITTVLFMVCAITSAVSDENISISIYDISKQWFSIEQYLLRADFNVSDKEDIFVMLDTLSQSVTNLLDGSSLYQKYRHVPFERIPPEYQSLIQATFSSLPGQIEVFAGVLKEKKEKAHECFFIIREELFYWQSIDSRIAVSIHKSYFYLYVILIVIIIVMMLGMYIFHRELKHSQSRERQSSAFSHVVVLAQEEERSRIARELHDSIAQDVHYLAAKVEKIKNITDKKNRTSLANETLLGHQKLIKKIRAICNGLIPPDFVHQGLPDALRSLCSNFCKQTGIDCRITIQEGLCLEPMTADMQLQCYRIVQEALTNIEKHAKATEAIVVLRNTALGEYQNEMALLICVSDDGKGFTTVPTEKSFRTTGFNLGIRGMYERVHILGGTLRFISAPGEGTMVRIEAPLKSYSGAGTDAVSAL
ncbi:MAG: sensor histidine kinase [Treponema sp.]|jgi:signal transduction histidine kinase|nr:sensor histidine kinase [Treponema sp.]